MSQLDNQAKPGKGKIQLTKGYAVNFDQLARLLDAVCRVDRGRIPLAELAAIVGVADAHVEHLCSIAHALGLLQKITYKATALGQVIQKQDPFFDDLGTLWFLHYAVSSNPQNVIWNRLVTEVIPQHRCITRDEARATFDDLRLPVADKSLKSHNKNILRELRVVLDAYTDQNFARLDYIHLDGDAYVLGRRQPIAPLVLCASIVRFRDQPSSTALP